MSSFAGTNSQVPPCPTGKIHKLFQATATHSFSAFDPRVEQPARSLRRDAEGERIKSYRWNRLPVSALYTVKPWGWGGHCALRYLVHVLQPTPRPQHLVASPQPLRVPSPQRGHGQIPHEAAAVEQQVLHSTHEHRGHASSFPRKPGCLAPPGAAQGADHSNPSTWAQTLTSASSRGSIFHHTGLSRSEMARLRPRAPGLGARQPTAAAGTH